MRILHTPDYDYFYSDFSSDIRVQLSIDVMVEIDFGIIKVSTRSLYKIIRIIHRVT